MVNQNRYLGSNDRFYQYFFPLAFSQIYEVVRPLVSLLNTERDGIQNYESLVSLTNLAALNDKLR